MAACYHNLSYGVSCSIPLQCGRSVASMNGWSLELLTHEHGHSLLRSTLNLKLEKNTCNPCWFDLASCDGDDSPSELLLKWITTWQWSAWDIFRLLMQMRDQHGQLQLWNYPCNTKIIPTPYSGSSTQSTYPSTHTSKDLSIQSAFIWGLSRARRVTKAIGKSRRRPDLIANSISCKLFWSFGNLFSRQHVDRIYFWRIFQVLKTFVKSIDHGSGNGS